MDRSSEIEVQAAWYMLDHEQTVLSDQGKYEEGGRHESTNARAKRDGAR
jgi:hypothetical protein